VSAVRIWKAKKALRRLIAAWEEFGKAISQAAFEGPSEKPVDKALLDLEARIAVDLPCLYEFFTGTYLDDEIREEVRSVSELVKRYTGKSLSSRLTQDEAKGMMAEWNSHFVFMNRILGSKGKPVEQEELGMHGGTVRRPGALQRIGSNSALRFTAKALVVIVLVVAVVNVFGGHAGTMLGAAVAKLTQTGGADGSAPDYGGPSIGSRISSWQRQVQVFTAEHRSLITMVAVVVLAFAVLYLILFKG